MTIGTYGEITTRRRPSGLVEARTRYRDWDGVARLVQASAASAAAATRALKAKCAERNLLAPKTGTLGPDSPFDYGSLIQDRSDGLIQDHLPPDRRVVTV
ncbi:hypothetical protein [Sinomonas sp. G460-2]|uniref:hypothetical protein n=1 Tax=Sinomonas sp. G460-2 TaxID=3393464 RepID=UPI0039EE2AFE